MQLLGGDGVLRLTAQEGFDEALLDLLREIRVEDFASFERTLRTGERVVIADVDSDELDAPSRASREGGRLSFRAVDTDRQPRGPAARHAFDALGFTSPAEPRQPAALRSVCAAGGGFHRPLQLGASCFAKASSS